MKKGVNKDTAGAAPAAAPVKKRRRKKEAAEEPRKFLPVAAVARRWDVSRQTIYRLIDEGNLKMIQVRREIRVMKDSMEAYERKFTDRGNAKG